LSELPFGILVQLGVYSKSFLGVFRLAERCSLVQMGQGNRHSSLLVPTPFVRGEAMYDFVASIRCDVLIELHSGEALAGCHSTSAPSLAS
jgi:hypothetical protein